MKKLTGNEKKFASELFGKVSAKRDELCAPGQGKRTEIVRDILHAIARKHGFTFLPYKTDTRHRREFLCDFVWLRWRKQDPTCITQVGLVAECEWTNKIKSILLDFRKLMLMKCNLKLCIYQIKKRKTEGTSEEYRRRFEDVLAHYTDHRRGEHYFLLELDRRNEEPPRLFFWRAGSKGCIRNPQFSPLEPGQ